MSPEFERFIEPNTLTILCTYRCTAACKQCCFESSPDVVGRLTLHQMCDRIDEARNEFASLQLVVFSGGEALLLKKDLFAAIAHATSLGLSTRVVSNGFWGKSPSSAKRTAEALHELAIKMGAMNGDRDLQLHAVHALIVEEITAVVNAMERKGLLSFPEGGRQAALDAMTRYAHRVVGV